MLKFIQLNESNRIKLKILLLLLDWVLDIGTTAYHFANGRWVEAALTYFIVFGSGCVITVGFLRYPDMKEMIQGTKEAGLLFRLLLYIPTFFPVVSAKLWLNSVLKSNNLPLATNKETQEDALKHKHQFQDWAMKALWAETVFEAKPQALLQTLYLLESTARFSSPFDALPIILAVWSVHSITNSIYDFVVKEYVDTTSLNSRLFGISYTVLSILSPVMVMSVTRSRLYSYHGKFLGTIISLAVYYTVFEIIYQLTYLVSVALIVKGHYSDESPDAIRKKSLEKSRVFSKLYQLVVCSLFLACAVTWYSMWSISPCRSVRLRKIIVLSLTSLCLCVNLISCIVARSFVTEVYRLKNVKIDENWLKIARFVNKDASAN